MAHSRFPHPWAAVIFDMDGLMLDTERIYHRIWRAAAQQLGYELPEELLISTTGRTFPDCYRLFQERMGPDFPLSLFQQTWPGYWNADVAQHGVPPKPGLAAMLEWLDALGVAKAVATSTTHDEAHLTFHAGGIAGCFVTVVTGDQITHGKPAPDIYLLAAARLGVDPAGCVALEDSEAGVLSAAAAGMYTIMVPDTKQPSPTVAAQAAFVARSLNEARSFLAQQHQRSSA